MSISKITIVGLGAGDLDQMPIGIYRRLKEASRIYLRTEKHPVVRQLREEGIEMEAFDHLYEEEADFSQVYERICSMLLELAAQENKEIVYAVPGHPMVAEKTTQLLLERSLESKVELEILGGQSFLDAVFTAIQVDPVEGFTLLDALTLEQQQVNPRQHLLITQIYDSLTASDVKLTLMNVYPDEYPVKLVFSAGVKGEERMVTLPLYELDHWKETHNLAILYVPPTEDEKVLNRQFSRLREIITILRSPEGCPWDREQTHRSIRKNLIEETYEVLETIDDDDPEAMCEEMGDLLMQVMLHAQIAEDDGEFTVEDVVAVLNEKLIRRHPHVFGNVEAETSDDVVMNWEQIKAEEKREKGIDLDQKSALSGIPRDLPALMTAYKISKKASAVGFDWEDVQDVYAKVEEELAEVKAATDPSHIKEELGDVLFAVANLARFLKVDAEEALALTNRKFKRRFEYIEKCLGETGRGFADTSLEEMERYWQEAKQKG
ncbi:MAG TPA: nucleoside triphosphate pyrophosphohydrolase [Bacillota bacterium]|nr:nucleoside triphosphate pyrophosphohydrolase [Bacillota bacterium]